MTASYRGIGGVLVVREAGIWCEGCSFVGICEVGMWGDAQSQMCLGSNFRYHLTFLSTVVDPLESPPASGKFMPRSFLVSETTCRITHHRKQNSLSLLCLPLSVTLHHHAHTHLLKALSHAGFSLCAHFFRTLLSEFCKPSH